MFPYEIYDSNQSFKRQSDIDPISILHFTNIKFMLVLWYVATFTIPLDSNLYH